MYSFLVISIFYPVVNIPYNELLNMFNKAKYYKASFVKVIAILVISLIGYIPRISFYFLCKF